MLWSEKELVSKMLAEENVLAEQVMAKLDMPENQDLFLPQNFSLLWGLLGVIGLNGAAADVQEKIWKALCDNGASKAFELGILADFTFRLAKDVTDERLRVWLNLDNHIAGEKFIKSILEPLLASNENLSGEIFAIGYQPWSFVEQLNTRELSVPLKLYLERIRAQVIDGNLDKTEFYVTYKNFLQKLTSTIVYMRRELTEAEKKYFCYYFQDILSNRLSYTDLGINDRFWSRLMLQKNIHKLSEIEYAALRSYNQDIIDFIASFEEKDGFYEECAAQSVYSDIKRVSSLTERCLSLAKKTTDPKGVVYAKALINLGQVKSAVLVLKMLARYGQATMMACYLNCLLPLAKGAENVLLQILCTNLFVVRSNAAEYMNVGYKEYITRFYLQAVRGFIDYEKYTQGAALLQEMVLQHWFDGLDSVKPEFIALVNRILAKDENSRNGLLLISNKLNLNVFNKDGVCYVGDNNSNNSAFIEISNLTENQATVYRGLVNDDEVISHLIDEPDVHDNAVYVDEAKKDMPVRLHPNVASENEKYFKNSILDINSDDIDKHFEQIKQVTDAAIQEEIGTQAKSVGEEFYDKNVDILNQKQTVEIWDAGNADKENDNMGVEDLLNITSRDVDNRFEYIKNLADTTMKKVEKLKDSIKEAHAFAKIKILANKLKLPHKDDKE